jgi:hypothetical protein
VSLVVSLSVAAGKTEVTVTAQYSQFPASQTKADMHHNSSACRRPTAEEEEEKEVEAAGTSSTAAFQGRGAVKLGVDEIAPHSCSFIFFFSVTARTPVRKRDFV